MIQGPLASLLEECGTPGSSGTPLASRHNACCCGVPFRGNMARGPPGGVAYWSAIVPVRSFISSATFESIGRHVLHSMTSLLHMSSLSASYTLASCTGIDGYKGRKCHRDSNERAIQQAITMVCGCVKRSVKIRSGWRAIAR